MVGLYGYKRSLLQSAESLNAEQGFWLSMLICRYSQVMTVAAINKMALMGESPVVNRWPGAAGQPASWRGHAISGFVRRGLRQ